MHDPAAGGFFRLHPAGYRLMGLLDGRRTVAEAWRLCCEQLGDEAPTQTEAVDLLGRLYAANLLQADLPPDVAGLFQRYRKRRARELRGDLGNFLFFRIRLFDPHRFLEALLAVLAWVFTPAGFVLWALLVAGGAALAWSGRNELARQAADLLAPGRLEAGLPALYAVFVLAKLVHEFAHGLACRKFGRECLLGGEVHEMGIVLLVLAPVPYVDASAAWGLPDRLRRVVVGAAGMMAELALAAAAAFCWAWTADRTGPWQRAVHDATFALMLISGVSTLAFNANVLLRFDGYYILADLLGIPNLAERSADYLKYLVRRYAWAVRGAATPQAGRGEKAWLVVYGLASGAFRVVLTAWILLMLAERFSLPGIALGAAAAVVWVVLPLGRLAACLAAGPELARTRARAVGSTLLLVGAAVAVPVAVDWPDSIYVEATLEPAELLPVRAAAEGFVREILPADTPVVGPGEQHEATVLLRVENRPLTARAAALAHERDILRARLRLARRDAPRDSRRLALAQVLEEDLAALDRQEQLLGRELAGLALRAPASGRWLPDDHAPAPGAYVTRGRILGSVVRTDEPLLRARLPAAAAGILRAEAAEVAEVRFPHHPERCFTARWRLATRTDDPNRPFEVTLRPGAIPRGLAPLPGRRAVVRFRLPDRPLAVQWWHAVRRILQRRLGW